MLGEGTWQPHMMIVGTEHSYAFLYLCMCTELFETMTMSCVLLKPVMKFCCNAIYLQ